MNNITYNIDLHKTDKQRMHAIITNCGKQKDLIWQIQLMVSGESASNAL